MSYLNKARYRRAHACVVVVTVFWLGILGTAKPASNRDQVAPGPDRPWAPPNLPQYENSLRKSSSEALDRGKDLVDLRKEYNLADLIDLAEGLNPATREAWQKARQALALVGVSKSAYYPFLSLAAAAGYQRFFVPFPKLQVSKAALEKAIATGGSPLAAVTLTEGDPLHFDILY
jgi:outer membrane protein TolC